MLNVKMSRENNAKFVSLGELMEDLETAIVETSSGIVLLVLRTAARPGNPQLDSEYEYTYIYLTNEPDGRVFHCDGVRFDRCRLYQGEVILANQVGVVL